MPPTDLETERWFAENLKPHEPSLRAYLRSSLPSAEDVDDIVQETYVRVLRLRGEAAVRSGKALLFAIARNAVRDLFRHRRVVQHEPITETDGSPVLQDGADVVEFVSRRQELSLLAEAIEALPPRCREVILLRKIQNLSQKEIAARLDISENTVETLVANGTRRCRDFFRERGADGRPAS